jgi:peptide/nickel transport system permease protein
MITSERSGLLAENARAVQRREGMRWRIWFGLRHNVLAWVAITFLIIAGSAAVMAPIVSPHAPTEMHRKVKFASPSTTYPFGTDEFGRDTLSRLMYGGRISLTVGINSVLAALLFGVPLGLMSGFFPWLDNPIMRVMDVLLTFPDILLAIAIMAALGPTVRNVMIAIAIINVPIFARITRALVLGTKQLAYVDAARALGRTNAGIIGRHILPNILSPLVVQATLSLGFAILTEAALSFLGLGTQPPTPSWGLMLNTARNYMEYSPWIAVFPGLAIALTVFSFNILGDFLSDVLDPRLK